ncbi:MAG TPA: hypothetical protein HA261_03030 [Methanosarcina sp.]|nr:hypothetical protein [Methanosarcina sp.]
MYLMKGIFMIYQDHPAPAFKSKIKSSMRYTLAVAVIGFVFTWIRIRLFDYLFLASGFVRFGGNSPWYHMRTLNVLLENYLFYPESCPLSGDKKSYVIRPELGYNYKHLD